MAPVDESISRSTRRRDRRGRAVDHPAREHRQGQHAHDEACAREGSALGPQSAQSVPEQRRSSPRLVHDALVVLRRVRLHMRARARRIRSAEEAIERVEIPGDRVLGERDHGEHDREQPHPGAPEHPRQRLGQGRPRHERGDREHRREQRKHQTRSPLDPAERRVPGRESRDLDAEQHDHDPAGARSPSEVSRPAPRRARDHCGQAEHEQCGRPELGDPAVRCEPQRHEELHLDRVVRDVVHGQVFDLVQQRAVAEDVEADGAQHTDDPADRDGDAASPPKARRGREQAQRGEHEHEREVGLLAQARERDERRDEHGSTL